METDLFQNPPLTRTVNELTQPRNYPTVGTLHLVANGSKAAFPVLVVPASSPWAQPKRLLSVGTRKWAGGLMGSGSLLNVRLYDYALYVNPNQVHSSLSRCLADSSACPMPGADLTHNLNLSNLDMVVSVRADRALPCSLLVREYEAILRRRLATVGGSPEDPALKQMMRQMAPEHIPRSFKAGASIRKGTVISFSRARNGALTTSANGHVLGTVYSQDLCRALFDVYLGSQPVCPRSKAAAEEALRRMVRDPERTAFRISSAKERLVCKGDDLDACVVQLS